jgi:hypothetical protein
MNLIVKNIVRLIVILLIQLFILNNIPPLHQLIVPYIYFVFILWLPFRITRMWLLFAGLLVGLLIDMFYKTPGLHAAASLFIAFMRPFVIGLLLPKETTEWGNEEPSRYTMGPMPYATYVIILTLMHHVYLIFLEWMQFGSFLYFMGKVIATTLVSLLLILVADLFLLRKSRTR